MPSRRRPTITLLAAAAAILPLLAVSAPAHAETPVAAAVAGDGVRINEVESDGGTPDDWIELVNTGSAPVDLSGWVVKDDDDTRTSAIAAGTVIAAGGYYVIEKPTIDFGLGKADQARLYLADGTTLVDSTSWSAHAATSYGRCADGTGEFTLNVTTTKGAANDCEADAAQFLLLNEVESSGGTPGDWVELVNTGDFEVDASGLVLTDSDPSHVLTVPAGSIVPARGYLAIDTEAAFGLGAADSARLFDTDGTTLIDETSWTTHAATSYGRCPDAVGAFATTRSTTKGAANDCEPVSAGGIRINEVESNGGTPGDWAELVNIGTDAVDVSGWIVKDSADDHVAVLPSGSTIAAGGYLVVEESLLGYGLGSADAVRLFLPDSVTVVDSYSWTSHAATSYGRCPDGTGDFAPTGTTTKGAVNDCSSGPVDPGTPATAWPGGAAVSTVDTAGSFGGNMSGLAFEPATDAAASDTLWAVKNGEGTLYRLHEADGTWAPDGDEWSNGKVLHYADGTGDVDAEGVALTNAGVAGGVFVSTERDNDVSGVSRPSILRFDAGASGASLSAAAEWNLAADLPAIAPNSGLEAIAWVPDAFLVERGLVDASTGSVYDPADYAGHGDGLFFVGLEANGMVYAYALDLAGTGYHRVAAFASGFPGVMDLEFDAEAGALWAVCDDTCNGRTATLEVAQSGAADGTFAVTALFERPAGMPNINNEGFAIAPQSRCTDGTRPVLYADDSETDGHALRAGTIDCVDDGGPTGPGTPVAPSEDSLTDGARGSVTVPDSVRAGETITVGVGGGLAGGAVDAWLFSTPVHLATATVSAEGTIRVTIPTGTAAGVHRLAVVAADGTLLGWDDFRVTAASGGSGAGSSAGTGLAATGTDAAPLAFAAALAVLLGLLAMAVRARRRAS